MREAQRQYFKDRTLTQLDVARAAERDVDAAIASIDSPQTDLFAAAKKEPADGFEQGYAAREAEICKDIRLQATEYSPDVAGLLRYLAEYYSTRADVKETT
jgi:hypothetical protein